MRRPRLYVEKLEARIVLDAAGGMELGVVPDRFIVTLDPATDVSEFAMELRDQGRDVYQEYNGGFKGIAFRGAPLDGMDDRVIDVEPERRVSLQAQTLPRGVDRMEVDLNHIANIDGQETLVDVDIAIIDTGIDLYHPDLNITAARSTDCATLDVLYGGACTDGEGNDGNGHGTHVAGTAAARDNDFGVVGVAPGARLWAAKVLDANGSGYLSWVLAGVNWVTEHADEIDVANMSLGFGGESSALRQAIASSVGEGVVYYVAAGNSAMDVFGPDQTFNTMDDFSPASFPEVGTVAALNDTDGAAGGNGPTGSWGNSDRNGDGIADGADDTFGWFSNFAKNVAPNNPVSSPGNAIDLLMPGLDILSTWRGGGYNTISGTSMASPHAAGLAGLFIAQHGGASDATGVYAIRQALINQGMTQDGVNGLVIQNDPDGNKETLGWAGPTDIHDVAVLSVSGNSPVIEGTVVAIKVEVQNQGTFTEEFTVSLAEVGGDSLGNDLVELTPGSKAMFTFNWTSAGEGDHTFVATASTVDGETETDDNTGQTVIHVDPETTDIAVTALSAPSTVYQGDKVSIDVTVKNLGNQDVGNFVVVLKDISSEGTTEIGSQSITSLAAVATIKLTYTWDTTSALIETHTLQATQSLQDDVGNNDSRSTFVTVKEPGSSGDGKIYFSNQHRVRIDGALYENEDIILYDGKNHSMFFDGSDVGLSNARIDAFAKVSDTELLFSFDAPIVLQFGRVWLMIDDSDVVLFRGTQFGEDTRGSFATFLWGEGAELTRNGEDIDGIDLLPDGRLLVSVRGSFRAGGLRGADEDIFAYTPDYPGNYIWGTWSRYFDGSDVGLSQSRGEDVDAFSVGEKEIYLSTVGNFDVGTVSGSDDDVFEFKPTRLGSNTQGTYNEHLFYDGLTSDVWSMHVEASNSNAFGAQYVRQYRETEMLEESIAAMSSSVITFEAPTDSMSDQVDQEATVVAPQILVTSDPSALIDPSWNLPRIGHAKPIAKDTTRDDLSVHDDALDALEDWDILDAALSPRSRR